MMLAPPANGLRLGDSAALDALGASKVPPHGAAQLDSALLMQLTAPPHADAAFFQALAEKYAAAAVALQQDGRSADVAKIRADEALSVEKSLRLREVTARKERGFARGRGRRKISRNSSIGGPNGRHGGDDEAYPRTTGRTATRPE